MMLELPVTNDPAQTFITQLGNAKYAFGIKYNDVSGIWTMDITDPITNLPILLGIPLVLGTNLLEPYNLNMGNLGAFDTTTLGTNATAEDMGARIKVYWWTDDEVPE